MRVTKGAESSRWQRGLGGLLHARACLAKQLSLAFAHLHCIWRRRERGRAALLVRGILRMHPFMFTPELRYSALHVSVCEVHHHQHAL